MKSLKTMMKEIKKPETLIEGRGEAEFYICIEDECKLIKWPEVSGWEQMGWEGGSRFGDFDVVSYQHYVSGEIIKFDCSDLTDSKGRGEWEAFGLGSTVKGKFKSFFDVEKLLSDGTLVKVIDRKWKKAEAMAPKVKGWTKILSTYDSDVTYENPELEQYFDSVTFFDFYDGRGYYTVNRRDGAAFKEYPYKTKDIAKVLKSIEDDVENGKFSYRNI